MKDKHIINLLESASLAELSESDLSEVRTHASECAGCHQAFEAAQIAALLLKERVGETFEPPPFFHTRVMAALRERQANDQWAWSRMWRSAGALASSMVATVAALVVLTFVIPGQVNTVTPDANAFSAYSAEEVILNRDDIDDQVSDGQVLSTLYDSDEDR
jgi:hypothetical protein